MVRGSEPSPPRGSPACGAPPEWGEACIATGPPTHDSTMETASFNLGTVLLAVSGLFVLTTLFFGTKGGYYDTDDYDGNGTAH